MDCPQPFSCPDIESLAQLLPAYEIESLIAAGGMGVVYRARQRSLDRWVALKLLPRELGADPEFRSSFETEARAMARLNHPSLISVYDFGEVDGMPYIAMEYVDGNSLFHSAQGIAVDPDQAVAIILGISHGLAHAHSMGIVHRDIKPGNILLNQAAEPKIGDFGLARSTGNGQVGLCMGTPGYVAPEVMAEPERADHRSDIFAVGVILYELLVGKLPEAGCQPPSELVAADPALDRVWSIATHPDPAQRYQDMEHLIRDLDAWKKLRAGKAAHPADRAPHSSPAKPASRPAPVRQSSPNLVLRLVVIGILLAAIGFTWNFLQRRPHEVGQHQQSGVPPLASPTPPPGQSSESPQSDELEDRQEPAETSHNTVADAAPSPAKANPPGTPPFLIGVWSNLDIPANLMTFRGDNTCSYVGGDSGTWTWNHSGDGGLWVIHWKSGWVDTLHADGSETSVTGTNNKGEIIRFRKLPDVAEMPVETFIGTWVDRRSLTREWSIEANGVANVIEYADRSRNARTNTIRCSWERGPNGDQITVFWEGRRNYFNILTCHETNSRKYIALINQRNMRSMLVPADAVRLTQAPPNMDLTEIFPVASQWEGTWNRDGGASQAVTCVVTQAGASEARLEMRSEQGSWMCIVRPGDGGRPEIVDVRAANTSRYSDTDLPGTFDARSAQVRFSGLGTLNTAGQTTSDKIDCTLTRSSANSMATASEPVAQDGNDTQYWKTKAMEKFPDIMKPSSEFFRQMQTLKAAKAADPGYFRNPRWPYLLAEETAAAIREAETRTGFGGVFDDAGPYYAFAVDASGQVTGFQMVRGSISLITGELAGVHFDSTWIQSVTNARHEFTYTLLADGNIGQGGTFAGRTHKSVMRKVKNQDDALGILSEALEMAKTDELRQTVLTIIAANSPSPSSNTREVPPDARTFKGNQYRVFTDPCTWHVAKARCEALGGRLAVIHDEATQQFVAALAAGREVWLGATDEAQEGRWIWVDGSDMDYRFFKGRQPDDFKGSEDYLQFWADGRWNDTATAGVNGVKLGYICEWLPPVGSKTPKLSAKTPNPPRGIVLKQATQLSQAHGGKSAMMEDLEFILSKYGQPENDVAAHPDVTIYQGPSPGGGVAGDCRITYLMPRDKAESLLFRNRGIVSRKTAVAPGFPPGLVIHTYDIRFRIYNRLYLVVDQADQVVTLEFKSENTFAPGNPPTWKLMERDFSTFDYINTENRGRRGIKIWTHVMRPPGASYIVVNMAATQFNETTTWYVPDPLIRQILYHLGQDLRKQR